MRHRTFLLLALTVSSAAAQDVAAAVTHAQRQVITYLPDLQVAPLARALKQVATTGVPVYLIAPRKAHMIQGSFLPSVALANAEHPPQPLSYHFKTLNTEPFVVIDNRSGYQGWGLVTGGPAVRTLNRQEIAALLKMGGNAVKSSPAQPAHLLIKERFGLRY